MGQGAHLVRENIHEIDQPGDVEDLHIMIAQAAGEQAAICFARPCEQADYQSNACAVDIINIAKVEQDYV